jgi:hypothetical protein
MILVRCWVLGWIIPLVCWSCLPFGDILVFGGLLFGTYICDMASNQISVTQYANDRGITRQAVLKQIKKGRSLPNILHVEKIGQTYVLTVIPAAKR